MEEHSRNACFRVQQNTSGLMFLLQFNAHMHACMQQMSCIHSTKTREVLKAGRWRPWVQRARSPAWTPWLVRFRCSRSNERVATAAAGVLAAVVRSCM